MGPILTLKAKNKNKSLTMCTAHQKLRTISGRWASSKKFSLCIHFWCGVAILERQTPYRVSEIGRLDASLLTRPDVLFGRRHATASLALPSHTWMVSAISGGGTSGNIEGSKRDAIIKKDFEIHFGIANITIIPTYFRSILCLQNLVANILLYQLQCVWLQRATWVYSLSLS